MLQKCMWTSVSLVALTDCLQKHFTGRTFTDFIRTSGNSTFRRFFWRCLQPSFFKRQTNTHLFDIVLLWMLPLACESSFLISLMHFMTLSLNCVKDHFFHFKRSTGNMCYHMIQHQAIHFTLHSPTKKTFFCCC